LLQAASAAGDEARAALELLLAEASLDSGDFNSAAAAASRTRDALASGGQGTSAEMLDSIMVLAKAALRSGDLSKAAAHVDEAGQLAAAIGDPLGLARSLALRGSVAASLGDVAAAHAAFNEALQRAERSHFTRLARRLRESIANLNRTVATNHGSSIGAAHARVNPVEAIRAN
jgi:tetratricopeptide (TPR) repeat protein